MRRQLHTLALATSGLCSALAANAQLAPVLESSNNLTGITTNAGVPVNLVLTVTPRTTNSIFSGPPNYSCFDTSYYDTKPYDSNPSCPGCGTGLIGVYLKETIPQLTTVITESMYTSVTESYAAHCDNSIPPNCTCGFAPHDRQLISMASSFPVGSYSLFGVQYGGANSNAVSVSVNKANSTLSLSSSSSSIKLHQAVTIVATVGGYAPTGTVTFSEAGAQIGSASIVAAGGGRFSASISINSLPAGSDPITANYSGDANNTAASGGGLTVLVEIPPTDFLAGITGLLLE